MHKFTYAFSPMIVVVIVLNCNEALPLNVFQTLTIEIFGGERSVKLNFDIPQYYEARTFKPRGGFQLC